jgi:hypothetical protein
LFATVTDHEIKKDSLLESAKPWVHETSLLEKLSVGLSWSPANNYSKNIHTTPQKGKKTLFCEKNRIF